VNVMVWVASEMVVPEAGEKEEGAGGLLSATTFMMFVFASVPVLFASSVSRTESVKVEPVATELHPSITARVVDTETHEVQVLPSTEHSGEVVSLSVNAMTAPPVAVELDAGAVIESVGAVVSMTKVLIARASLGLPAASVTVTVQFE